MQEAPSRLVYNADDGSLMIETSGPAITIDGLSGDIVVERLTAEGDMALPLWLSRQEIEVLSGMVRYALKQIEGGLRTKEGSDAILSDIHARLTELAAAGASDEG